MRLIDADKLNDVFINVADHLEESGRNDMASIFRCAVGYVNMQPDVDAAAYFDAADRIKPCPNCRYMLAATLSEEREKRG